MRDELLKAKAEKITQELTRWAKRSKILNTGECIVFSLRIGNDRRTVVHEQATDYLSMSTEIFFSTGNLVNLGMPGRHATIAHNAMWNNIRKCEKNDWRKGVWIYKTMEEFVEKFQYESQWQFAKFGKITAHSLADALRKAGLWT